MGVSGVRLCWVTQALSRSYRRDSSQTTYCFEPSCHAVGNYTTVRQEQQPYRRTRQSFIPNASAQVQKFCRISRSRVGRQFRTKGGWGTPCLYYLALSEREVVCAYRRLERPSAVTFRIANDRKTSCQGQPAVAPGTPVVWGPNVNHGPMSLGMTVGRQDELVHYLD
ncbi:uncharacterized protein LY79DRAFT_155321 [Colletotrichum navitas]|uniref:Uncharacterized protein n=1 Tax=Colletotrichum navitas TaxID=681940 RepID=A0AAD8Q386_9PEZI|nr:uncharacterized protein LY79DRAFT_155321 [Colletotrichum navitas]KAK1594386.1 hypothetical protein LY79DRAFT_155321 [Colletotrichum navitas]